MSPCEYKLPLVCIYLYTDRGESICTSSGRYQKNFTLVRNNLYIYVHTCTMMYMKVHEFRKNLKQAFDDALHGESVIIERGGVKYQLIADGIMPKITDSKYYKIGTDPEKTNHLEKISSDGKPFPIKTRQPQIKFPSSPVKVEDDIKFCKHGAVVGFCKKGCKS